MTLTLELTPAEEERLRRATEKRGQEMAEYARAVLLPADDSDTRADSEFWQRAATPAADAVWDNPEDDAYAELLAK